MYFHGTLLSCLIERFGYDRDWSQFTMTETVDIRDELLRIADRLPDGATWEDLQYEIYVRQSIEAGLADSRAGRLLTEAEVRRRLDLPA